MLTTGCSVNTSAFVRVHSRLDNDPAKPLWWRRSWARARLLMKTFARSLAFSAAAFAIALGLQNAIAQTTQLTVAGQANIFGAGHATAPANFRHCDLSHTSRDGS